MRKMLKNVFLKNKELLLYILFGALTTLVNFVAFGIFTYVLGDALYLVNNAAAWVLSVIFAYITNKLFVFNSKSFEIKCLLKECSEFLAARIFSFAIEEMGLWLLVDALNFDAYAIQMLGTVITGQMIAKLLLAVIVVILNYFFSKFFIFATKNKED